MRKFLTGFFASLLAIGYIAGVGAVFRAASPGVSGGGVLAANPLTFPLGTTFGEDGAANVLAEKNTTTAQELRVYGTTTGPKYLSLKHDGSSAFIDTAASSGALVLASANANSLLIGTSSRTTAMQVRTSQQTAPTVTTNGGTSPSCGGTDTAMVCTIGTAPPAAATFTVTFNGTWPGAVNPSCVATRGTTGTTPVVTGVVTTTTTAVVNLSANLVASEKYNIICMGVA